MNAAIAWIGGVAGTCFLIHINQQVWAGIILGLTLLVVLMLVGDTKQKRAAEVVSNIGASFQAGTKH